MVNKLDIVARVRPPVTWTEERTQALKTLWPDHTSTEIAAILSAGSHHVFTRSRRQARADGRPETEF
jgi:hypothetical protein